jgi:pilus assembly protein TadC
MVVRGLFGWQQRRLANQLFRQLPDTIELVTSTVRSGLPVNEAFRTISHEMPQPTAGQFAFVCSELSLGRPPEEAVEDVYRRTQVAEYRMFAVTLAVQMKSGGSLTETLQTLGDTVRQRVALAARAKALVSILIGGKTVSMFLFPILALFVAGFFGKSPSDLPIFAAIGAVIGIMGPRLILSVLRRRFNAAIHRFAGCVQRSGNGPGERAGTSSGRNEPV